MSGIKGVGPREENFDGSNLRVAIVHARWNVEVISALVDGAKHALLECGVKEQNIVVQTVPGSFELPMGVSKVILAGQNQANATATDLLGGLGSLGSAGARPGTPSLSSPNAAVSTMPSKPFDAVIAIGVLIKGATMHFEYICDSVTHALMRLQMDSGIPVIYGVLTALTEDQALERAGIGRGESKGHNHGEDWGYAAVEMGTKANLWGQGKLS